MRRYLRWRIEGATWFFTLVTYERRRILTTRLGRKCLRSAILKTRRERPFQIIAIVLLPDHLHCVVELPRDDTDYSTRLRLVKSRFTRAWLTAGGCEGRPRASLRRKHERAIWQRRFYEHFIRDEEDLERCVDYIHWNPVKHGHTKHVIDYPWSSFHRYVRLRHYERSWGGNNPVPTFNHPDD